MSSEVAFSFKCQGESLCGIVHLPEASGPRGVLLVVGGPQYRVGSHRQFVLLARDLAARSIPVFRFDYRGMGDSCGNARTFDGVGEDIKAAIDEFFRCAPGVKEVVLWGLCDAASAALLYAHGDVRVTGMVLLNPWVHTAEGEAKAYIKHYYVKRLASPAFWKKLAGGGVDLMHSVGSLLHFLKAAASGGMESAANGAAQATSGSLPDRMRDGFSRFAGPVLILLSGNDLTAEEFKGVTARDSGWQRLLERANVEKKYLKEADHTFSRQEWRDQVSRWTAEWVESFDSLSSKSRDFKR